jgi:hypothetical protein
MTSGYTLWVDPTKATANEVITSWTYSYRFALLTIETTSGCTSVRTPCALVCDEGDGKVSEFSEKFCSYTGVHCYDRLLTSINFSYDMVTIHRIEERKLLSCRLSQLTLSWFPSGSIHLSWRYALFQDFVGWVLRRTT